MDPEILRSMVRDSGVDLWALIDGAISVAVKDHCEELRARRDAIVERLFARRCRNCDDDDGPMIEARGRVRRSNGREEEEEAKGSSSPAGKRAGDLRSPPTPQSMNRAQEGEDKEEEDEDLSPPIDAKSKILAIKDLLEDPDQSDDSLINILQNLADMDLTFKVLEETDIGRHVYRLRKTPSPEIRRLVKQLVRKWKEIVDDWVKNNSACENGSPAATANITDGDSPLLITGKSSANGHRVSDFDFSPNPHNGSVERVESKTKGIARSDPPAKQSHNYSTPSSASPAKGKEQTEGLLDAEKLASATKRLHENYQEAQNAKKQRTIQVMDIHEIPKTKNSFIARNKGGAQAKHW